MTRLISEYTTKLTALLQEIAKDEEENAITRRFFGMLEETIRKEPPYYLWTHNRWKRTKEELMARMENQELKHTEQETKE